MSFVTEIANDSNERLTAVRIVFFYAHASVTPQRIPTLVWNMTNAIIKPTDLLLLVEMARCL